jgi:hypothetical protein
MGSDQRKEIVGCTCGTVQLELTGEPIAQFFCHCDDCQTMHGAAYVPESAYPTGAVKILQGNPSSWQLKTNPRVFCSTCGTRLFIDVRSPAVRGVNSYLLPEGLFRAAFHMHCQFAVRPVKDNLPHYKSRPARLGGSDETVEW